MAVVDHRYVERVRVVVDHVRGGGPRVIHDSRALLAAGPARGPDADPGEVTTT